MLKIGDFSKLSRISIRMLRHYDEIGLLKPETVDDFTGYRYYSAGQLSRAARITMLKNMGFGLTAITEIISNYGDAEALSRYLQIKYTEVKQEEQMAADRLKLLESAINRLGKDESIMKFDVTVKEIPERNVAALRKTIANYNAEGTLWQQLMQEIGSQNVQYANPCYAIAVFHDMEYKESDIDVEIQISVDGAYNDTENVQFKTTKPVTCATVIVKGSYDQLAEVNEAVCNWIDDNGYEWDGVMFNIYHVSPSEDPNPDNWVTEVCYPVKKK